MLTIKVIEIQHLQPFPPSPASAYQAHDCLPLSVCVCGVGIASLATVNLLVMN